MADSIAAGNPIGAWDPTRRAHKWKCPYPGCYAVIMLRYNRYKPLPTCTGGRRDAQGRAQVHPAMMLVSEVEWVYQECFNRHLDGHPFMKPLIHARNIHTFPQETPGESPRDLGDYAAR